MAEGDVVARRTREAGLPGEGVEQPVAQLEFRGARPALLRAEAPADIFHEVEKGPAHRLAVGLVLGEGMLAGDGFLHLLLMRHGGGIDPERMVADGAGGGLAEEPGEEARVGALEVGAGAVAVAVEEGGGLAAHAPEDLHGLRREEVADAVWVERHHEEAVRLALLGGDLGEQTVRGEPDGAGYAAGGFHVGAELLGERHHAAEEVRRAGDVEKGLVDGDAFDERRVAGEHRKGRLGDLAVDVHARPHEDTVRTLRVGRAARHSGAHAERPRLVGAGGDDTALVRARPDDDGLASPFGMVPLLDRREEGVHIHMQDDHCSVDYITSQAEGRI